jgi:hypothetical protein
MGWSSDRSVPSLEAPGGSLPSPGNGISSVRLLTMPKAMVPSWQLRQSFEAPAGWPGTEKVELE